MDGAVIFNSLVNFIPEREVFIATITDPNISESEVAKAVAEDIESLKPDALMQTFKEISPFLLAIAYNLVIVIITLFIGGHIIKFLSKILDKFLKRVNIDSSVRKFLISTFKVALYVLVIMGLAEKIGINQASIVAILGSAGVAIGLAWQGSLSNFAGGMIILFSRPFVRGDYIVTSKGEGNVDVIGIIYTALITGDNKRITIPNGILANDVITNVTANDIRRIDIKVGVSYDSDIRLAKKLIKETFYENGLVINTKEVLTYVEDLASSAVIMGGRAWCKTSDYWTVKWSVMEEIKVKFDSNDIKIPFDQLEVHINESKGGKGE